LREARSSNALPVSNVPVPNVLGCCALPCLAEIEPAENSGQQSRARKRDMRVWLLLLASALVATRGTVPATCSFSSLEDLNRDLNPHLEALVKRPLFNFYRISLRSQCVHKGFVPPMCGSPHCSVCECPSSDLPCDKSGRCFLDDLQGGPKARPAIR